MDINLLTMMVRGEIYMKMLNMSQIIPTNNDLLYVPRKPSMVM